MQPKAAVVPRPWRGIADIGGLEGDALGRLRVLLAADIARRAAAQFGAAPTLLAIVATEPAQGPPRPLGLLEPTGIAATLEDAAAILGGPADLTVQPCGSGAGPTGATAGRTISIALTASRPPRGHPEHGVPDAGDPLALRLALLRIHNDTPAELSHARLRRAEETLDRWRFKVASWHDMPPATARPEDIDIIRTALLRHADAATALTRLHRVEADHTRASGAKFDIFTQVDRVLGLDLSRLIGKLRG